MDSTVRKMTADYDAVHVQRLLPQLMLQDFNHQTRVWDEAAQLGVTEALLKAIREERDE